MLNTSVQDFNYEFSNKSVQISTSIMNREPV